MVLSGAAAGLDTLRLTAEEAMGLLERSEASAAELHTAYLDAIAARDGELHCYLRTLDEPNGTGIPIALKDVISTKGVETTAGSKILAGYVPVFDSTVAARCKAAGLSILGKTNTDEFAMGSSTENSAYGPTRNPWDPERVPGGSGGGSAAAVTAGLAPWALGSDTGGSIKQPSALCGNVGLRPTYGTVSRYGIVAFASSLDQIGPVARNVRDCALLYSLIAGRDECDSTTVELPEPVRLPEREDLQGIRIGVPREMNEAEGIEPGVADAVARTVELARELGAEGEGCELPRSVDYGLACYYLIAPAEASSNLARYDGVRYGLRVGAEGYYEMVERSRAPSTSRASSAPRWGSASCRARSTTASPATTSSHRPRRRPTSPATTASVTACASAPTATTRWSSGRATRALATSPNAASCSAPTPSRRATTRPSTARPRRCGP